MDTQGDAFFVAFPRAGRRGRGRRRGTARARARPDPRPHGHPHRRADRDRRGLRRHRRAPRGADRRRRARRADRPLRDDRGDCSTTTSTLRDLGEHRLKDLIGAERLYQLGDGDFPPLRTLDATNLPVAASPLVGRERELDELVALLSNGTRLLTLTGPGRHREDPPRAPGRSRARRDGCATASSGCRSPASRPRALCRRRSRRRSARRDDLAGFLRGQGAPAPARQLRAPPRRRSRGQRGPRSVRAAARARDEPGSAARGRRAASTGSSRSRPRTRRRSSSSALGRSGASSRPDATVEAICRRLDGLPLAIELAAARTKLLAPEQLLERLDSALPLLTGGARDAPERQRTLRATIEWSYDLLDAGEPELFARLAVFAGAFPLDAAEEVCDADLDGLAALVDSSLLKPIGDDRFLMLETIREYALERLESSDDADEVRRAARRLLPPRSRSRRTSTASTPRRSGRSGSRPTTTTSEPPSTGSRRVTPTRALELAGALGWFWLSHGHLVEGRGRLAAALAGIRRDRSCPGTCARCVGCDRGPRSGMPRRAASSSTRRSRLAGTGRPGRARLRVRRARLAARLRRRRRPRVPRCVRAESRAAPRSWATRPARRARSSGSARCSSRWGTRSARNRSHASCSSGPAAIRARSTSRYPLPRRLRAHPRRCGRSRRSATARACGRRSRSATSSRRASRCRAWRWRQPARGEARHGAAPGRVGRGAVGVARRVDLRRLLGRAPRAVARSRT